MQFQAKTHLLAGNFTICLFTHSPSFSPFRLVALSHEIVRKDWQSPSPFLSQRLLKGLQPLQGLGFPIALSPHRPIAFSLATPLEGFATSSRA